MKKRRLLLGAGALACLGLAVGLFVWLTYPRPRVTPENFRRLRLGMTRPQVEAILGQPAGVPGPMAYSVVWEGRQVRVTLDFFPDGDGPLTMGDLTFLDSGAR